jgi:hypothetical protein
MMEAVLGASKNRLVTEKRSPLDLAADYANVVIDAFAPLGQTATATQFFSPTVADPFVQAWENKRFSGTPMVPERGRGTQALPRSEMYFGSNSEVAKDAASWLNRISGGNEIQPGWLDVYPGHLDHAWSTVTGGPGTFGVGMFDFGKNVAERALGKDVEPLPASRIPFAGKFYGEVDERAIEAKFYRLKEQAEPIAARIKALKKAGDIEAADQLEEQNVPLVEFARAAADKRFVKERSKSVKEMRATRELPLSERAQAKREIKREQAQLYLKALEAYNQAAMEERQ